MYAFCIFSSLFLYFIFIVAVWRCARHNILNMKLKCNQSYDIFFAVCLSYNIVPIKLLPLQMLLLLPSSLAKNSNTMMYCVIYMWVWCVLMVVECAVLWCVLRYKYYYIHFCLSIIPYVAYRAQLKNLGFPSWLRVMVTFIMYCCKVIICVNEDSVVSWWDRTNIIWIYVLCGYLYLHLH